MTEDQLPEGEPVNLRFLRRLVTLLTAVMIIGVSTIVLLLVMKLGQTPAQPALPEALELPEGAEASAITFGPGWIAIVDRGERVLLYDPDGTYRGTAEVIPAQN